MKNQFFTCSVGVLTGPSKNVNCIIWVRYSCANISLDCWFWRQISKIKSTNEWCLNDECLMIIDQFR